MNDYTAPQIEKAWVCVATNKQVALAAVVSSYFQDPGVYFAVFEFPSIEIPYAPSIDYTQDETFARILGHRAALWINNAMAKIQPERIVLVGLTDTEKSYFRHLLSPKITIEIQTLEDTSKHLSAVRRNTEAISCRSSQIAEGLLCARFAGKGLVVDDGAPLLPNCQMHNGTGILIVESSGTVDDLIAINYGFALNADVVLVPSVDRRELHSLPRQLQEWSHDRSSKAFDESKRKITSRIKGIDFSPYKFASFFTVGLPYGLVIKNVVPSTHLLKSPFVGMFIANAITAERRPRNVDSALIFSPQLFTSEETGEVANILDANNYKVKALLGENATLRQLNNYGALFPFDVMHICSHGGETPGYYVTQEFTDREGKKHKLEYYEVIGVSPAPDDMVNVETKAIYVALDGIPWMSPPLKAYPRYVFHDMFKAFKDSDEGIVRKKVDQPIALSSHIQCYDSIHQGAFDNLAAFGHPLIFNNTCSSSHEMATMFIAAGARGYLGTLWAVENEAATQASELFYREALRTGSVLAGFAAMDKSLTDSYHRNVYIYWGLHCTSFRKPLQKSDRKVFAALVNLFMTLLDSLARSEDSYGKKTILEHAQFVRGEIMKMVSRSRLGEMQGFDPNALTNFEESLPPLPESDERGVVEVTISTELRRRSEIID